MDLLIDTFGTKIGSTGKRIVLSFPKIKEKKEYPIHRVSKIVILRPVSLTINAMHRVEAKEGDCAPRQQHRKKDYGNQPHTGSLFQT